MSRPKQLFSIEEEVRLKTDPEQLRRIVTRFTVSKNDITYELAHGIAVSWHYGFEIQSLDNSRNTVIGYANKKRNK